MTRKTALLSLLYLFLFTAVILNLSKDVSAFNLPDTGQTKCYQGVDPWAEIPCAGTGQDGEYNINPMSYTDNGNGTVSDNNTGLMWQKCSVGQNNDSACSGTSVKYNWYKTSGTYHAQYNPTSMDVCGDLVLGGHSDWRLPVKKELITLVDYSVPPPGPTINTTYFPNTKSSNYWLFTTYADDPNSAWYVNLYYGYVGPFGYKDSSYYVRCVRSGQTAPSFSDNGNGTVTDIKTGLIWQQGESGYMRWGSALSYCNALSLAGKTDWRLPNIKELESITDDTRLSPAFYISFFPSAYANAVYWSSTTYAGYPFFLAWGIYSYNGAVYYYNKSLYLDNSHYNYARCVQDGVESFDYYCDNDGDTYMDSSVDGTCSGNGCEPQGCQTTPGNDCDDSDPLEYPNQTWYKDTDNDLFSSGNIAVQCSRPSGYKVVSELTATYGDSDDDDPNIYPKIRANGTGTTYYSTFQSAYNASITGDTIQSEAVSLSEDLNINLSKTVTLQGGYNAGYTSVIGETTINGNVTISSGIITIENFILQ